MFKTFACHCISVTVGHKIIQSNVLVWHIALTVYVGYKIMLGQAHMSIFRSIPSRIERNKIALAIFSRYTRPNGISKTESVKKMIFFYWFTHDHHVNNLLVMSVATPSATIDFMHVLLDVCPLSYLNIIHYTIQNKIDSVIYKVIM